jgi:hypothetical protein
MEARPDAVYLVSSCTGSGQVASLQSIASSPSRRVLDATAQHADREAIPPKPSSPRAQLRVSSPVVVASTNPSSRVKKARIAWSQPSHRRGGSRVPRIRVHPTSTRRERCSCFAIVPAIDPASSPPLDAPSSITRTRRRDSPFTHTSSSSSCRRLLWTHRQRSGQVASHHLRGRLLRRLG